MKPYYLITLFLTAAIVGCQKYDDTLLQNRISDVEQRLIDVENRCYSINQELKTLRELVDAAINKDGISSITRYSDEETGRTGYTLNFTSGRHITILDGKNGTDAPRLGVKQDTDGVWYWTLNGAWMLDEYGHRVIASGRNGQDGQNGSNGITPQLRIEDGYWQISYDNGATWDTLGKATGEDGKDGNSSIFAGVDNTDSEYVIIKLTDGTSITLPRYRAFILTLDMEGDISATPGAIKDIAYTIDGATESVQIETIAEGVKASVLKTNATSGKIHVVIGDTLEDGAHVLIFVVDRGETIMRKLTFENSVINVTANTAGEIDYTGGEFVIDLMTNADVEILIPSEASSWVSHPAGTKSVRNEQKHVVFAANENGSRSVTLTVKDRNNPVSKELTILQQAHPDCYESSDYSANGTWKKIQSATTDGNGLNIVFLGDAYTDKMIADGTYDTDMSRAMEHFFEVEPYASLRNMFNCYQVFAVSRNNNYKEGASSVFQCQFGTGTRITGQDDKVRMYAQKVTEIQNGDPIHSWSMNIDGEEYVHYSDIPGGMLCVVVLNSTRYAGTCSISTDGTAVAYCPLQSSDKLFAQVIHHEAGGHGFARLADEYGGETTLSESRAENLALFKTYGFYQNVDTTDNPETIYWSRFLKDGRYASTTGVYEGGYVCNRGVWRPSENSIMRDNTGGYNAPSREIIYKRAMELSKGASYVYDFEDFAAFDATLTAEAALASECARTKADVRDFVPFAEPVITFE